MKRVVRAGNLKDFKQDPKMMVYHHIGVLLKIPLAAESDYTFQPVKKIAQGIQV